MFSPRPKAPSLTGSPTQFFISLTILAIAADFIRHQVLGDAPVTTRYSTFTGGFGMLVCGVGAAALFVTSIPALVPIALDGLMGLFFLAGGIVRFPVELSSSIPRPLAANTREPKRHGLSVSATPETAMTRLG